jgi:hypothetical protein
MSTHPDFRRADDELITLLSHWLNGSLGNDELRRRVQEVDGDELAPGQRTAVHEVLAELATAPPGERDRLQPIVKSTIETLVYGD